MEQPGVKFFVGGIPGEVKKKLLKAYFSHFGKVKKITTFNSNKSQRLLGYCFVYFEHLDDFSLYDQTKEFVFRGRYLQIEPVVKNSNLKKALEEKHQKRVYVPGVPLSWEDQDLFQFFSTIGPVDNAFIVKRKARGKVQASTIVPSDGQIGMHKLMHPTSFDRSNYGFVIFSEASYALKLIEKGTFKVPGSDLVLQVKEYVRKGQAEGRVASDEKVNNRTKNNREIKSFFESLKSGPSKYQHTGSTTSGSHHFSKPTQKSYYSPIASKMRRRFALEMKPSRDDPNYRFNRSTWRIAY